MNTKTYITFLYQGSFLREESSQEINHREPNQISIPDNSFGYYFWDRTETVVDGETLKGKAQNQSGTYYPGGSVWTAKEVEKSFPSENILITNMKSNGYDAVRTRQSNWVAFRKGDHIT